MYKLIFPETVEGAVVLKLRKTLSAIIMVLLFVFGSPLFLAGLLLLGGDEFMWGGMFLTSIGIFLLCGALLILQNRQYPEKLIFDNSRALLRIVEKRDGEYGIPYSEISNFYVGIARQKNAGYFTVEMGKKDGAVWTLAVFAGRPKAEEAVSKLERYVHLQSVSSCLPESGSDVLDGVSRYYKDGISVIEWKQRFSLFHRIIGYAAIFAFALMLYSIVELLQVDIVGYYIAIFFALALTIYSLVYFLYSFRRVYVLEIGRGLVRYYTKGIFARGLSFDLPIDRIDSVFFNFSIQRAESVIYFLSREQRNRLIAIMRGDVGDILDSISFMMHIPRVDMGGFTVSEKLKLEKIIQQAMREHGAKENL